MSNKKEVIDLIMTYPYEDVVRLLLDALEPYQLTNIRSKLSPHWADERYGSWSHNDPLLISLFDTLGKRHYTYKDGYTGDMETDYVNFIRCKCCGEEFILDDNFHDYRYSHVFASCKVTNKLMRESKSEEDWRKSLDVYILNKS